MEILVPLGFFFAAVTAVGQLTRLASNLSLHKTLREAMHSDPASVPILAERLDARQPWADALLGWIFIAFAVGILLVGMFEPGDKRDVLQVAIVSAIVGATVLLFVRQAKKAATADMANARQAARPAATAPPKARRTAAKRGSKRAG